MEPDKMQQGSGLQQPSNKAFAHVEVTELNMIAGGITHRSCGDKGLQELHAAGGKCESH